MRRARHPCIGRQSRDLQGPRDPANIHDVGLNDVDYLLRDHLLPRSKLAILFAARYRELERISHRFGLFEFPIGARLLIMLDALGFQELTNLDRALRGIAGIGVRQFREGALSITG